MMLMVEHGAECRQRGEVALSSTRRCPVSGGVSTGGQGVASPESLRSTFSVFQIHEGLGAASQLLKNYPLDTQ